MEIWKTLLPILLADMVNPVLFAFMVYAAGTRQPVKNSSALLLGHTVAYLAAGIVLSYGLEAVSERLANPKRIDFVIQLLISVVLLWIALRSPSAQKKDPEKESPDVTPLSAFGFGMVINFVGIPFALPYFAAISQILKLDAGFFEALYVLVAYNIIYALPFLIVPALVVVMGDQCRPLLTRISATLDRLSDFLMPILLALVALVLLADSAKFFVTGEPLL